MLNNDSLLIDGCETQSNEERAERKSILLNYWCRRRQQNKWCEHEIIKEIETNVRTSERCNSIEISGLFFRLYERGTVMSNQPSNTAQAVRWYLVSFRVEPCCCVCAVRANKFDSFRRNRCEKSTCLCCSVGRSAAANKLNLSFEPQFIIHHLNWPYIDRVPHKSFANGGARAVQLCQCAMCTQWITVNRNVDWDNIICNHRRWWHRRQRSNSNEHRAYTHPQSERSSHRIKSCQIEFNLLEMQ